MNNIRAAFVLIAKNVTLTLYRLIIPLRRLYGAFSLVLGPAMED